MEYHFQITTSFSAAAELPKNLITDMAQRCIHDALDRNKGEDGGDVFSFNYAGKEWSVVVAIGHRWAKIMSKDEFEEGEAKGMRNMATSGKQP